MEIIDYLRAKGPQLAVLVLLPCLAGAMAFYVLAGQPARYRGELQVRVPGALASGTSGLGLYVANFRQALSSPEIVDQVSEVTGARGQDLREGLEVRQVGQANQMELDYISTSPDLAVDVPRVAAQATLETLAAANGDFQRRELAIAEERYTEARAEIDRFRSETGILFPEDEYEAAAEELRGLEEQLAEAEAAGLTITAAGLRPQVDAARANRDLLGQQLLTYQPLMEALDSAGSARRSAGSDLITAEAQLDLARSPELLDDVETGPISRGQTLLAGVAIAAGAAFLLGLGVLAAPDVLRRGPAARQPERAAGRRGQVEEGWLGVYVAEEELADVPTTRLR